MAGDLGPRPLRGSTRDRELFVDRETELSVAQAALERGGNVLVLGEWGAGKTSFLHRLGWSLEQAGADVVLLNGRAAHSAHDALAILRGRFDALRSLPLDAAPGRGRQSDLDSGTLLLDDLLQLRESLAGRERVMVLLDEAPSPGDARTLFGRLRDELWELPAAWCVAANSAHRAAYTDPPADAFWSSVIELRPFPDAEAALLLERRLRGGLPPEIELATVVREARGNPRLLLALADAASQGRPPTALAEARRKRIDSARTIGPAAERLLADIEANGPTSASDQSLLRRMGWTRGRAAQVLKQLEEAGLLVASDRRTGPSRPQRIYALRDD